LNNTAQGRSALISRNMGPWPEMVVQTSIGGFALRRAADLQFRR
jgi:hypothetical protein